MKWKRADGAWIRRATTARTRLEAQRLHAEFIRQAERQRHGLEPMPPEVGFTLWKLCEWYLEQHVTERSRRRSLSMFRKHVKETALGALPTRRIAPELLEAHFESMQKDYSPRSINLLRSMLGTVLEKAKRARLWAGDNPVRMTHRRAVPVEPRPTFSAAEVELIIENVPDNWRPLFATAAYLGLRKGELCGLRKSDYDAEARTLAIKRSYGHVGTKGKRVDVLPVIDALAAHLAVAMKTPGPAMFPGPDGQHRTEDAAPEDILRSTLKRIELIDGYRYVCRRCKARGLKPQPLMTSTSEPLRCPTCNMLMWCSPVARRFVFHDLRHTCATLLLKAGVPVQHVQRILRHATITITVDTYGHLLTEDLRSAVEKLGPGAVHGANGQTKERA